MNVPENFMVMRLFMQVGACAPWKGRSTHSTTKDCYPVKIKLRNKRSRNKNGKVKRMPADFVKDPFVLEFLGLHETPDLRENKLEQALIDHLQKFILELGRGVCLCCASKTDINGDKELLYRPCIL